MILDSRSLEPFGRNSRKTTRRVHERANICLFRSRKVYVDFHLGDTNGLEAARELYMFGFREITLTTGYRVAQIEKPPWLKEIIGKTAPWRAPPVLS